MAQIGISFSEIQSALDLRADLILWNENLALTSERSHLDPGPSLGNPERSEVKSTEIFH